MTDTPDADWTFDPWTPEGAARLRAAADALAGALRAHAEAVIAAVADQDVAAIFAANDLLQPLVSQYADAQFDFSGTEPPFELEDPGSAGDPDPRPESESESEPDPEPDPEPEPDSDPEPGPAGISVLQRRDYAITDEPAVLAVGRAAYLQLHPEHDEAAAAADVTDLGRALYQAAHAGEGFADLDEMPGLAPTGAAVVVLRQAELLLADVDDWPPALFDADGPLLYEMHDVYTD